MKLLIIIILTLAFLKSVCQETWEVNPYEYETSATLTGQLKIDCKTSVDPNDKVGAFINGECRGVGSPKYYGSGHDYFVMLMIFGGFSEEKVVFKVYNSAENQVTELTESFNYVPNGINGSISSPYIWYGFSEKKGSEFDVEGCEGDILRLGERDAFESFLWSTGGTESFLDVSTSGTYYVNSVCENGTVFLDTFNVKIHDLPNLDLGGQVLACLGDTVSLNASVEGAAIYSWNNAETSNLIEVTTNGSYDVQIILDNGCIIADTVEVVYYSNPVIKLPDTVKTCSNELVAIDPGSGYSSYLWSDGSTSSTINTNLLGWWSVQVSNIAGCISTDSTYVLEYDSPDLDLGEDILIKDGQSLILDGGIGWISYLWNTNETSQSISVNEPGEYSLTVTDQYGCQFSDELTVTPRGSLDVISDIYRCNNNPVTLDATHSNAVSYLWSDGTTLPEKTISIDGIYNVTIELSDGSYFRDSAEIIYVGIDEIPLDSVYLVCYGESIVLDAGESFKTYLWNTGETTHNIIAETDGEYLVRVINKYQCRASKTTNISFFPKINIDLGNDRILCPGDSVILQTDGRFDSYLWNTGETDSSIFVKNNGTFFINVVDSFGCNATDTININPVPQINLESNYYICPGSELQLDAGEFKETNVSYLWDTQESTKEINVSAPGVYHVVVDFGIGCQSEGETEVLAITDFNLEDTIFGCVGEKLTLNENYSGMGNFQWSTGEESSKIIVGESGNYCVSVDFGYGCSVTDSVRVILYEQKKFDLGLDITACQGETIELNGPDYFSGFRWDSGEETQSIYVVNSGMYGLSCEKNRGCLSRDSIYVHFISNTPELLNISLFQGEEYNFYGTKISQAGIYVKTLTSQNGCDQKVFLNLQILDPALKTGQLNVNVLSGENPLANIFVVAKCLDGKECIIGKTFPDGHYLFNRLKKGQYYIYAITEYGYENGLVHYYESGGSSWQNADLVTIGDTIADITINLEVSELIGSYESSEHLFSISGNICHLYNNNFPEGFYFPGEINYFNLNTPIPFSNVVLYRVNNTGTESFLSTITNENGFYYFNGIPQGNWLVMPDIPGNKLFANIPEEGYFLYRDLNLSFVLVENDIPTSIIQEQAMSLNIYPNPTHSHAKIVWPDRLNKNSILKIVSESGVEVFEHIIDKNLSNEYTISVKDWASGLYIVCLQNNEMMTYHKLIVK